MIPIIEKARSYYNRKAIYSSGNYFTYEQLVNSSEFFANSLLIGAEDLNESRVVFITKPGFNYVMTQWAIWLAGGVAVPVYY